MGVWVQQSWRHMRSNTMCLVGEWNVCTVLQKYARDPSDSKSRRANRPMRDHQQRS